MNSKRRIKIIYRDSDGDHTVSFIKVFGRTYVFSHENGKVVMQEENGFSS